MEVVVVVVVVVRVIAVVSCGAGGWEELCGWSVFSVKRRR